MSSSDTAGTNFGGANTNRITSAMPASEIIAILSERQCPDITDQLDLKNCQSTAFAGGGFADVHKGVLVRGESVAIKCPRLYIRRGDTEGSKVLKHVARELYTWSRLKHDNILELLGLAQFQGHLAMVALWMENGTLLEYLKSNPTADRYCLLTGITSGVAYLHQNDTIHGDLKSGNVLISGDGVAKLADFGCTELKSSTLCFSTTTSHPFSARWAAPEILQGVEERTRGADVYALGMILLEIITGQVPFSSIRRDIAIIHTVCVDRQTPGRPEEFPTFGERQANLLWDIMRSCWTYDSSKRPKALTIKHLLAEVGRRTVQQPVHPTTMAYNILLAPQYSMGAQNAPRNLTGLVETSGEAPSARDGEAVIRRTSALRHYPLPPASAGISRINSMLGCITCRIRQKRCLGFAPGETSCRDCTRLNIQCLGVHHNRPDWLRNHHLTECPIPRGRGPATERPFLSFQDLIEKFSPTPAPPSPHLEFDRPYYYDDITGLNIFASHSSTSSSSRYYTPRLQTPNENLFNGDTECVADHDGIAYIPERSGNARIQPWPDHLPASQVEPRHYQYDYPN